MKIAFWDVGAYIVFKVGRRFKGVLPPSLVYLTMLSIAHLQLRGLLMNINWE
jgi:hypothetical protein